MKHNITVTAFLIFIFLVAQIVGLALINIDIKGVTVDEETGEVSLEHSEQTEEIRPQTKGFGSFLYLAIGVTIGTVLVLILMKYNKVKIWKFWFFLAVFIAINLALMVVLPTVLALLLALGLAIWKILRPNLFVHNITEILMYAGIGVLLIPIFNLFWVFMILIAISVYDIIAVWFSKHMVGMAKFQTKSSVFAGLMIPYKGGKIMDFRRKKHALRPPEPSKEMKAIVSSRAKTAILGGGDIAFPLLFTGVVMEALIKGQSWLSEEALTKPLAFSYALIITIITAVALLLLFVFAKKDRFYPAMPFITAGCVVGFFIVKLLLL